MFGIFKMKRSKKESKVKWYASTTDIAIMGPFATQTKAWKSLCRTDGSYNKPGDNVWPMIGEK